MVLADLQSTVGVASNTRTLGNDTENVLAHG